MNKLIYIADDDDNIRNLLKTFLEREGFHVTGFPTGDKLFEVFSSSPADLIILDVMMPGHDGFFILKEIRKTSNVPIIMLTAKDSDADYISPLLSSYQKLNPFLRDRKRSPARQVISLIMMRYMNLPISLLTERQKRRPCRANLFLLLPMSISC